MFQVIATAVFLLGAAPHGDVKTFVYNHAPFATEAECVLFKDGDEAQAAELRLNLAVAANLEQLSEGADGFKVTVECVELPKSE